MSEATASKPVTGSTSATAAQPKAGELEKKSITLTFEGDDLALHAKITKQAIDEDRTPSIELLRFVRKNFGKVNS